MKKIERKEELIRLFNVKKKIGDNQIIDGINLSLYRGEVTGIVGDEDSGIDVLCRLLSGDSSFQEGSIYYQGERIKDWQEGGADRNGVFRLHSGSRLTSHFNLAENLCMLRPKKNIPASERLLVHEKHIHLLAREYLEEWGLKLNTYQYPASLSPTEYLLVMIIRAEMCHCRLLILDHVCGKMAENNLLFEQIFRELKKKGVSLILAERNPDWMERLTDRVVILRQGRLIGDYYTDEYRKEMLWHILTAGKSSTWEPGRWKVLPGENSYWRLVPERKGMPAWGTVLRKGEIIGIFEEHIKLTDFLKRYSRAEDMESGCRKKIMCLLGVEQNFGLFSVWSCCENMSKGLFGKQTNPFGVVRTRILEYIWKESYPDLSIKDAWKNIEELNVSQKLHLAVEGCRKASPAVVFLDGMGHGMDIFHLHVLEEEVRRMSEDGITIILWNPTFFLVRQYCSRILMLNRGNLQKQFYGEELMGKAFQQYYCEWRKEGEF